MHLNVLITGGLLISLSAIYALPSGSRYKEIQVSGTPGGLIITLPLDFSSWKPCSMRTPSDIMFCGRYSEVYTGTYTLHIHMYPYPSSFTFEFSGVPCIPSTEIAFSSLSGLKTMDVSAPLMQHTFAPPSSSSLNRRLPLSHS